MSSLRLMLPTGTTLRVVDVVLTVWVALWIGLGVAVHGQVQGLRELSSTVVEVGGTLAATGSTLVSLGDVPIVGDRVAEAGRKVEAAATETVRSGRAARDSVRGLAVLLGIAVAVIPSIPVIGFWVPLRLRMERDRRALSHLARAHGADPEFRRYLAHRALFTLPHAQLAARSAEPWHDYVAGNFEELAAMEFERLGLDPGE